MLYSLSILFPIIIFGIGADWIRQLVQALVIPIYSLDSLVYVGSAYLSDKIQQHGIFCIGSFLTCTVGCVFLVTNQDVGLSFAGCFMISMRLWTSTGAAMTWLDVNSPRYGKRAFASGMQLTIGNAAGESAPFLFNTSNILSWIWRNNRTACPWCRRPRRTALLVP